MHQTTRANCPGDSQHAPSRLPRRVADASRAGVNGSKGGESAASHSMFCTCSRICSIATFISTAMRVVSRSCDFEASVLASRLNSCSRKSSRRPAASGAGERAARLVDVPVETIQFLGHIQPMQQQHDLLLDALLIELTAQFRKPLLEARTHAREHLRQASAHLCDQRGERIATLHDEFAEPSDPRVRARRSGSAACLRTPRAPPACSASISVCSSRSTPGQRSSSSTLI